MKKLFFLQITLSLIFCNGQNINIKQIDKSNTEQLVKYLAKQIPSLYKEQDKAKYYDNIFRVSLINEDYKLSLAQLDSVRNIYKDKYPYVSLAMGTQYEVYIKSLQNKTKYEEEFRLKYSQLPLRSQILLPQYFNLNEKNTKKIISEILKEKTTNDIINIQDALSLCRNYIALVVFQKTFSQANGLLKKLNDENFVVYDGLKINTEKNGNISLSVVINNKIPQPSPTILFNTIYSDKSDLIIAKEYALKGYSCVVLNTRGKYLSTNTIEPFEHEYIDINSAIDWITKQSWSDGKVGMIGGSYLGFSQWAATKKLHPALKTIIPQAPVGIGAMDFPMNNNVFSSYILRWINYVTHSKMTDSSIFDEKKWNPVYKQWYETGKPFRDLDSINGNKNIIFQRWLNHPSQDDYWDNMVPLKQEYSKINIPVLTITGYYDSDQLGALYYLKEHYRYNKNANHYLIIGPYDHSGAQGDIKTDLRGYKIDKNAEIDINEISISWFDYVLKGKQKPTFIKDKINYQVMGTNQWKSTNSMNNLKKNTNTLYLSNNKQLIPTKAKIKNPATLTVDFKERSDADEILALKYDLIENNIYNKNNIIFSSEALKESYELTGNFRGKLSFSINKKDVDLYAYLYEQFPNGKYFLLSTYLGRASYNKNWQKRHLLSPNKKESIFIKNNEFVSKKIEKGSKIILVVGVNKSPMYQINYGTGKDVSDESIEDADIPLEFKLYNDSFIEIPIFEHK